MAKILEFRRIIKDVEELHKSPVAADEIEDYISAVINDYSLTVANRHWLLDNMLMDIDDQLDDYKKELEEAERKLDTLVKSAEREIEAAYREFNSHVDGMTHAVKKLTCSAPRQSLTKKAAEIATEQADCRTTPRP